MIDECEQSYMEQCINEIKRIFTTCENVDEGVYQDKDGTEYSMVDNKMISVADVKEWLTTARTLEVDEIRDLVYYDDIKDDSVMDTVKKEEVAKFIKNVPLEVLEVLANQYS